MNFSSALIHRGELVRRSVLAIVVVLVSGRSALSQRVVPPVPPVPPVPAATRAGDLATMDLEQLMKIEVVFAGSKRPQETRSVGSFVSVVTAAEIKEHGYRTLADVLKTLASFYVTNDRNYSVIGVRGFNGQGEYGARVLLLLDGLRTNDNLFGQALAAEEFVVDVALIDHIEVIRGPSAAIYGSNAFFAVINVVTKQGRSLQGGEAAASAASYGTYAGRASYGNAYANGLDVLVSGSYSNSKGQDLFFPEFNTPANNRGVAVNADYETSHKLLLTATKGNLSFLASVSSRDKGIPTASFGTLFNDNRSKTTNSHSLASLSYSRAFEDGSSVAARVHTGYWRYIGDYVYVPIVAPNQDNDVGAWWGADVDGRRTFSRHLLTVGAEYKDNFKQNQLNYNPEPLLVNMDLHNRSVQWGLFAQDEIALLKPLTMSLGLRYDHYKSFGSELSPRVGLIYTPDDKTTLKVLAGRAFRAPDAYELYYDANGYEPNLRLQPEQIETLELVAQRFIGSGVQVTGSAFRNRLSALITQVVDPTNQNFMYDNADAIDSKGLELGVEVNHGHGVTGGFSYALQRTNHRATGIELANSPRQMAKAVLRAPLGFRGFTAGLDAQYTGDRRTLTGQTDARSIVTNLSLLAPRVAGRFELSATVYNLFGAVYGVPGGAELVQDIIMQDGRSFRVKTTVRY